MDALKLFLMKRHHLAMKISEEINQIVKGRESNERKARTGIASGCGYCSSPFFGLIFF